MIHIASSNLPDIEIMIEVRVPWAFGIPKEEGQNNQWVGRL